MPAAMSPAVQLKAAAQEIGFELVGIAPAVTPSGFSRLHNWLERGFAGEMNYLARREAAYAHPRHVLESVRSLVVAAWNYKTSEPNAPEANEGRIARYAWGTADYHDFLRDKLQQLADRLHELRPGCRTRTVIDTAPLLERDFAQLAGLGWFGKNTMLINKHAGSFLFLGVVLTDAELEFDAPHQTNHCGTCMRCLEVCPTQAFPEPYVLDARRCISYLTIELKSQIPRDMRTGMGEWLFGCDLCQDVCPWNRKSPRSATLEFQPESKKDPASALSLLTMGEAEFTQQFGQTPLSRPGWVGMRRNAAVVLGNRGDERAVPPLIQLLDDPEPVLRGVGAWALGRLGGESARAALQTRLTVEDNPDVIEELNCALGNTRCPN